MNEKNAISQKDFKDKVVKTLERVRNDSIKIGMKTLAKSILDNSKSSDDLSYKYFKIIEMCEEIVKEEKCQISKK